MAILSDKIEVFIKTLMGEKDKSVDLQRNELAQHFSCAPSQINYVIKTRFNLENGFYTESRRGGGGYIRIIRISHNEEDYVTDLINNLIGLEIKERNALGIISNIYERKLINKRETAIMMSAMRSKSIMAPLDIKDIIRASILKSMLTSLICSE